MIFGTPANDPINMIFITFSFRELFQHQYTDPFASHIAIGLCREGLASSIRTQHPSFMITNVQFGRDQSIDTANNGHSTLTTLNGSHTSVNSYERTRTRS